MYAGHTGCDVHMNHNGRHPLYVDFTHKHDLGSSPCLQSVVSSSEGNEEEVGSRGMGGVGKGRGGILGY